MLNGTSFIHFLFRIEADPECKVNACVIIVKPETLMANMGSLYLLNCIFYFPIDSSTSCLKRALVPYYSQLYLLLNHVVIVVNLCCVEGLMEDRCISNKHSSFLIVLYTYVHSV